MAQRIQDELAAFFFEYDTSRMVLRNKKVGGCLPPDPARVLVYAGVTTPSLLPPSFSDPSQGLSSRLCDASP